MPTKSTRKPKSKKTGGELAPYEGGFNFPSFRMPTMPTRNSLREYRNSGIKRMKGIGSSGLDLVTSGVRGTGKRILHPGMLVDNIGRGATNFRDFGTRSMGKASNITRRTLGLSSRQPPQAPKPQATKPQATTGGTHKKKTTKRKTKK
jgi:hypothetical protein